MLPPRGSSAPVADEKQLVQEANIAAAIALIGPSTDQNGQPDSAKIGAKSIFGFNLRWQIGSKLTVCMAHQDRALRALIVQVAMEWLRERPNLTLDFGDLNDPRQCSGSSREDIRIADDPLSPLSPYWSYIGTQAKQIQAGQPTMDLGFGGPTGAEAQPALLAAANHEPTRSYFHFVVLHEFGHALGALHEHQWGTCAQFLNDDPAVVRLIFPSATTPALQQQALDNLRALKQTEINAWGVVRLTNEEDPKSVMRYFFPEGTYKTNAPSFCTANSTTAASNDDLTSLRKAYPQPGDPAPLGAAAALQTAQALAATTTNLSPAAREQITTTAASLRTIMAPGSAAGSALSPPAASPPDPHASPSDKVIATLNMLANPPMQH
jgi:hypothetical protein